MATGRALFAGLDVDRNTKLWVTDGTSGGTIKLKVAGAGPSLDPRYITLFDGRAVFAGIDNRGRVELWVTDGTSPGTVELRQQRPVPSGCSTGFNIRILLPWGASCCSRA